MAENKLLLSRAKSAVLSRDYDFAARLYKQLLGESPENESLLLELGSVYSKGGKDAQALSVYQKIAQINPDNTEALMAMSAIYRRTRNYDQSVAMLEKARAIDSKNMQIVYNLGFTYKSMGKYDEAIACFEDVIDQNPSDVLAYNHIGAIYAEQGDHETAISSYLRALKVDSNHPIIQLNLAKSYEATGETEKALVAYENSLKAKPGWLEAVGAYSDLLLKLDRVHEAYALLRNAVAINPKDARTHTQLGRVYSRQSIFEDAKKEYATALECNSKYDPALVGLADAQENLNEHAEASRTIRRAEEIKPGDKAITRQAAHIMLSANEYADAFERIARLREQNPKDVQALSLLGQFYICNGEWDKVEECYAKIAEYDPTFSDHFRDGAKRFNQRGDRENEERYLRKAIERNPKDAQAMMSLGLLLENARRGKEAFAVYQQANAADTLNAASKLAVDRLQTMFGAVDITEYVSPADDSAVIPDEAPPVDEDALENPADESGEKESSLDDLAESDEKAAPVYDASLLSPAKFSRPAKKSVFDDLFDLDWVDMPSSVLDDVIVPSARAGQNEPLATLSSLAESDDELDQAFFAPDIAESVQQVAEAAEKAEYAAQQAWTAAQSAADAAQAAGAAAHDYASLPAEDSLQAEGSAPDSQPSPALPTASPQNVEPDRDKAPGQSFFADEPLEDLEALPDEPESEEVASAPESDELEMAEPDELEPAEPIPASAAEADLAPEPEELEPAEPIPASAAEADLAPEPEELEMAEPSELDAAEAAVATDELPAPAAEAELAPDEPEIADTAPELAEAASAPEPAPAHIAMAGEPLQTAPLLLTATAPLALFERLRSLCEYLPADYYDQFMSSNKRLLLDYVIARLSGNPGLLQQAASLRRPDAAVLPDEEQSETGIELATHVVDDVLTLIQDVPDSHLRLAMEKTTKGLIEKLITQ